MSTERLAPSPSISDVHFCANNIALDVDLLSGSMRQDDRFDVISPQIVEALPIFQDKDVIKGWENLERKISYMTEPDRQRVKEAFIFSAYYHEYEANEPRKRRRKSGEPYSIHPLAVAAILADVRSDPLIDVGCDTETIIAALLHDVLEDTRASRAFLLSHFGESVVRKIDGVTKVKSHNLDSANQAETVIKIFDGITVDPGIIMIKLADRLHNISTIGSLPRHKQEEIARQTLEYFVPLARRTGLHDWAEELFFGAHRILHADAVDTAVQRRKAWIAEKQTSERLERIVKQADIAGPVVSWDVLPLDMFLRVDGDAVLQQTPTEIPVYAVCAESAFETLCARLEHARRDGNSAVKGVRVLHREHAAYVSVNTSPAGKNRAQIQLRSQSSDMLNKTSIADVCRYGQVPVETKRRYEWKLQPVTEILRQIRKQQGVSLEVQAQKLIQAYTREIIPIRTQRDDTFFIFQGDTALDVAYRIHSDLGHTAVSILVNGNDAPWHTVMKEGDSIRITADPNRRWQVSTARFTALNDSEAKNEERKKLLYVIRREQQRANLETETRRRRIPNGKHEIEVPDRGFMVGDMPEETGQGMPVQDIGREEMKSLLYDAEVLGFSAFSALFNGKNRKRLDKFHPVADSKNLVETRWNSDDNRPLRERYTSFQEFLQVCAFKPPDDAETKQMVAFAENVLRFSRTMRPSPPDPVDELIRQLHEARGY